MDPKRRVRTSKFLSLVLRHDPSRVGITLDAEGWADIRALLDGCRRAGRRVTHAELMEVVRTNDKQRFALNADGTRVRARQGHSVPVDLALAPATPPELLYHGTVGRFLPAITAEGLRSIGRHDVHLSADEATARKVGSRRGAPVVLVVAAGRMHADGYAFRMSDNGVWLVPEVPPEYLGEPVSRA
ncbi:RNA 2'-phosphotransferase [Nocardiopsis sp. EMB25]|uniref:RNA 2'-phosphotransferase n=1 Tax=Nocardiopsis sp. EMB25 TaxID=2835867 RepID=UPI002285357B|nr:RNA 2'-phosphotransferase [Nocardiopsis sp. EMB25]MCY9786428.1 RNA 2'-phosphotransferase [Nocardiopsis sp. EMB25]